MEIRKLSKKDVVDYINLVNQLESENNKQKENMNLKVKETGINKKKYVKAFKKANSSKNHYIIGIFDDKLVGTAAGTICPDLTAELSPFLVVENVIVDKNYRGKGIGKKLMAHMEKYAIQKKCRSVVLQSSAHRQGAHSFYNKLGYSIYPVKGFKKYL